MHYFIDQVSLRGKMLKRDSEKLGSRGELHVENQALDLTVGSIKIALPSLHQLASGTR
jgi:hypothetical protein